MVIRVMTESSTGQNNDTFEHTVAGTTSEPEQLMSSKGNINTASLPDDMNSKQMAVTRNGQEFFVSDISDLKDSDIVNLNGIPTDYATIVQIGMKSSLQHEISKGNAENVHHTQGGPAPEGEYADDDYEYEAEAPETPTSVLESNLEEAVRMGDCSPNVASQISVIASTADMNGVSVEDTISIYAHGAVNGFDPDHLASVGLSEHQAMTQVDALKSAIDQDVSNLIGSKEYDMMQTYASRYEDAGDMFMQTAVRWATGSGSRSDWSSLYNSMQSKYGDRA